MEFVVVEKSKDLVTVSWKGPVDNGKAIVKPNGKRNEPLAQAIKYQIDNGSPVPTAFGILKRPSFAVVVIEQIVVALQFFNSEGSKMVLDIRDPDPELSVTPELDPRRVY